MPEEYRFLRYYIPGSLFLMYLTILIVINNIEKLVQYLNPIPVPEILGAFAGFFVVSPPIGYIIYQFYDWVMYRRLSKCKTQRITLRLIDKWATQESVSSKLDETKQKELIDFALYFSLPKPELKVSEKLGETIRGFWSHANTRLICSIFVPFFSLFFFLLSTIAINSVFSQSIFIIESSRTSVILFFIGIISLSLGYPAFETIREAFALEECLVRIREQEIRAYMRKLKLEKLPTASNS